MKIITPRRLIVLLVLLPVLSLAAVFLPGKTTPLSFGQARAEAGSQFTKDLWSAKLAVDVRDQEGYGYFDTGVNAFDNGASFKDAYKLFYRQCSRDYEYKYCTAVGDAFQRGYSYAREVHTYGLQK